MVPGWRGKGEKGVGGLIHKKKRHKITYIYPNSQAIRVESTVLRKNLNTVDGLCKTLQPRLTI